MHGLTPNPWVAWFLGELGFGKSGGKSYITIAIGARFECDSSSIRHATIISSIHITTVKLLLQPLCVQSAVIMTSINARRWHAVRLTSTLLNYSPPTLSNCSHIMSNRARIARMEVKSNSNSNRDCDIGFSEAVCDVVLVIHKQYSSIMRIAWTRLCKQDI